MMKKKLNANCVFCEKMATRQIYDKLEFFSSKNRNVYLCEKCFETFSAGSILGQFQLNNKILSLIANADDKAPVLSLKEKIIDYAPSSKIHLFNKNNKTVDISPKELYEYLNKKVIGQNNAKKRICLTVYEHLKASFKRNNTDKHNILFLGPSGSGKTLIVNSISKKLNVPYVIADATSFSPTGFQGADTDTAIHDLFYKADGDVDLAQRGVVFIDEIDKLASQNSGTRLESFNYSTQNTLLKLIEGKRVKIPSQFLVDSISSNYVDTNNVLFCFGGAFNGLDKIIAKKKKIAENQIGFRKTIESEYDINMKLYEFYNTLSHDILTESLIEFGLSTELVGRIQTIVPLKPLNKEELLMCLLDLPESPILKNKLLFAESNIELEFSDDFYEAVAERAMKAGTGARALNSIVKSSVSAAAFEYLGTFHKANLKILINSECVENPDNFVKA